MTKNLYLISFYFAPLGRADGVNRSYLSRYLGDRDWNIRVICADQPHGLFRNYQTDPSLLEVLGPRVERHGVPYQSGARNELAFLAGLKVDPFTRWVPDAVSAGRGIIDGPGIIYAVVPPVSNALVAWQLAKETGLPLVLDFRDNEFRLPPECVRDSALIVASTQRSLDDMRVHYQLDTVGRHDTVYYNGFPDIEPPQENPTADRAQLRMIYAGLLNWEQDPALLARASRSLVRRRADLRSRLRIDYFGPNNYYTKLALRAHRQDGVHFSGYIPFAKVREELSKASMGVTTLVAASKSYCIPSKVFQYLAAGLPLFAVTPPGALSTLIASTGIGVCVPPSPKSGVVDLLEDLLDNPEQLASLRENVRQQRSQFSLRQQISILDEALTKVQNA